ncbi:ureidoglycolate lyase [Sediminicoccus sp. KRV36]|uniref:ureidoglycolate lyase n=1 Tax=Sediminicoccus sp. KRV36 TaxID=3133721 RepID=UPI00200EAECD|nr:ureidoglycolate lyase [Sediminicoccus rosea]UPY38238.1 ureidoglycolate lyase [Sediminicoccus rosea]
MGRILRLEPLTAEAFRPFGDVMDPPALGERPALGASVVARDGASTPTLAFNHAAPVALPLLATQMERHNRSAQCFVPMDVSRWVVMVAPDRGGAPDIAGLRGFLVRGDQAVNYHLGSWHHPLRVLDRPARFAILMWTTGHKPDDEEWATLEEAVELRG